MEHTGSSWLGFVEFAPLPSVDMECLFSLSSEDGNRHTLMGLV